MDGRPNRSDKPWFSNPSGLFRAGPDLTFLLVFNTSQSSSHQSCIERFAIFPSFCFLINDNFLEFTECPLGSGKNC